MIKLNLKNYLKVKAFEWCEDKAFIVFIQMLRNAKIMIDVMFHEERALWKGKWMKTTL